jgi:ABC-2 type transport system permease protein
MIVANLFSGFLIPLAFFPGWLRTVADATPFPSMVQIPIDLFVGEAGVGSLLVQLAWAVALLALCQAALAAGTRRLVVQGG